MIAKRIDNRRQLMITNEQLKGLQANHFGKVKKGHGWDGYEFALFVF